MISLKQQPEVFYKIYVFKNSTKFTGKHLHRSLFFNKVACLRLNIAGVFLWILQEHFQEHYFFTKHFRRLLLIFLKIYFFFESTACLAIFTTNLQIINLISSKKSNPVLFEKLEHYLILNEKKIFDIHPFTENSTSWNLHSLKIRSLKSVFLEYCKNCDKKCKWGNPIYVNPVFFGCNFARNKLFPRYFKNICAKFLHCLSEISLAAASSSRHLLGVQN